MSHSVLAGFTTLHKKSRFALKTIDCKENLGYTTFTKFHVFS